MCLLFSLSFVGMNTLVTNIRQLVNVRTVSSPLRGKELLVLPVLENAYLVIHEGRISDFGEMKNLSPDAYTGMMVTDAEQASVLPCWCDSHTHLVFAASREEEFVDKIRGMGYTDIAAKGGGILNSARKLADTPEDMLFEQAWLRLQELMRLGTGAIEIKSGYGLTTESELKMLRVIRRIKEKAPIPVKATFLGAHAYPQEYRDDHEGYIRLLTEEMLPAIAAEGLADYIDVFCEEGFFSAAETERICSAGMKYGLVPKIHANQLSLSGGVQSGVALGALSVDHLETMDEAAIRSLAGSGTIGTLLPTAAFFLRMPFQPARQLIDSDCVIALASDFNPGSSPSGNMNLVVSMACIGMKMLPEEAINAATINGAYAMDAGGDMGSITVGKKANLIFTRPVPSIAYLPYAFGSNMVDKVMINGIFI
jgi:imidazolonepropionase